MANLTLTVTQIVDLVNQLSPEDKEILIRSLDFDLNAYIDRLKNRSSIRDIQEPKDRNQSSFDSAEPTLRERVEIADDFDESVPEDDLGKDRSLTEILEDPEIFGIWANRTDIENSVEWVREQRRREWRG